MKKKKLKKTIKKLRSDVKWLKECERRLAVNHMNFRDSLSKQQDDISKLKDSKFCKDDIKDLNNRMDGICMDVNSLRSNIERINGRCDILDRRTQTDYDKIIPKGENNGIDVK